LIVVTSILFGAYHWWTGIGNVVEAILMLHYDRGIGCEITMTKTTRVWKAGPKNFAGFAGYVFVGPTRQTAPFKLSRFFRKSPIKQNRLFVRHLSFLPDRS
jgi:hypothetical protein